MTQLADLVQDPGERHLVYGGTRTGKSSFMDWCMRHIQLTRPDYMMLVADTKPRFRANGVVQKCRICGRPKTDRKPTSETGLYTGWAAGPVVPNSVAVDIHDDHPFRSLWDRENHRGEIAIMQSDEPGDWRRMIELMHHFTARKTSRERLLVVDEGLDFYQRNTLGIDPKRDVILRTARAGGERNIGLLFGAHRPHGIPPLLNTLSSRVTLFYLRFQRDMRYLWEMGIPENEFPPDGNHIFKQYSVEPGGTVSDPVVARLKLPDAYLKQLAST